MRLCAWRKTKLLPPGIQVGDPANPAPPRPPPRPPALRVSSVIGCFRSVEHEAVRLAEDEAFAARHPGGRPGEPGAAAAASASARAESLQRNRLLQICRA